MRPIRQENGWTLAEMLTAMTVSTVLAAGLLIAAFTIQRSFRASKEHVNAQAQQMRLMDYINLDLRRALRVSAARDRLVVEIPDYYDAEGDPNDPRIDRGLAVYGGTPRQIEYFRQGPAILRREGTQTTTLATDVTDFRLSYLDLGQSIMVAVTFLPKFQLSGKNQESVRQATATFSTTLLRNKRQN